MNLNIKTWWNKIILKILSVVSVLRSHKDKQFWYCFLGRLSRVVSNFNGHVKHLEIQLQCRFQCSRSDRAWDFTFPPRAQVMRAWWSKDHTLSSKRVKINAETLNRNYDRNCFYSVRCLLYSVIVVHLLYQFMMMILLQAEHMREKEMIGGKM